MALIENAKYYNKIEESYMKDYLKLVCEHNERLIDVDHPMATDMIMSLKDSISKADKTIELLVFLLDKTKGVPVEFEGKVQKWFSILIVAVYMHYFYFNNQTPFLSIFYPRQFTDNLAKEAKFPGTEFEYMLQAVESALGPEGPQKLKAPADTPGEMVAVAISIFKDFAIIKKIVCGEN